MLIFQDLTSQLIQLEKHFNSIELNKFGENGGVHAGKRSTQRFGTSRYVRCTTGSMYCKNRWVSM